MSQQRILAIKQFLTALEPLTEAWRLLREAEDLLETSDPSNLQTEMAAGHLRTCEGVAALAILERTKDLSTFFSCSFCLALCALPFRQVAQCLKSHSLNEVEKLIVQCPPIFSQLVNKWVGGGVQSELLGEEEEEWLICGIFYIQRKKTDSPPEQPLLAKNKEVSTANEGQAKKIKKHAEVEPTCSNPSQPSTQQAQSEKENQENLPVFDPPSVRTILQDLETFLENQTYLQCAVNLSIKTLLQCFSKQYQEHKKNQSLLEDLLVRIIKKRNWMVFRGAIVGLRMKRSFK